MLTLTIEAELNSHLIYQRVIIKARIMNINQIGTMVAKERKVNAPAHNAHPTPNHCSDCRDVTNLQTHFSILVFML